MGHKMMKVMWRRGQKSQVKWVRYPVEAHHVSVMTRGRGVDQRLATSAIQALGALKSCLDIVIK